MATDNDPVCITLLNVFLSLLWLVLTCIMIWFLRQYLRAESDEKRKRKANKCLYYTGILFGIVTILIGIVGLIGSPLDCRESTRTSRRLVGFFGAVLTVIHLLLLLALLFARLRFIFQDTQYPISRCSVITFVILYISFILSGGAGLTLVGAQVEELIPVSVWTRLLISAFFMFYVLLNVFLVSLYVYKLVIINKASTSDKSNDRILSSITKATVLTVASVLSTLVSGMVQTALNGDDTKMLPVLIVYAFIANDTITNFLAIYLGYGHFTNVYLKVCGCCDSQCKSICYSCVGGNKTVDKMQHELQLQDAAADKEENVESVNSAVSGDETAVI